MFDLDGTLVDSSPCHDRAYREALTSFRPDLLPQFDYEQHKGKETGKTFRDLGVTAPTELHQLSSAKRAGYLRQVEDGHVRAMPGAHELLARLAGLGKRLFLVTGGNSRSTAAVLESTGLARYLEGLVTGDTAPRSKPAPDPFLTCLTRFHLDRERSLAIEDAANGIASARASGVACLAVNNPKLAAFPEYAGTLADLTQALVATEVSYD